MLTINQLNYRRSIPYIFFTELYGKVQKEPAALAIATSIAKSENIMKSDIQLKCYHLLFKSCNIKFWLDFCSVFTGYTAESDLFEDTNNYDQLIH